MTLKPISYKSLKTLVVIFLTFNVTLLLQGCGKTHCHPHHLPDAAPKRPPSDLHKIPNATPRVEPLSKSGNRFKRGTTNVYKEHKRHYKVLSTSRGYRKRGYASWYGTKFHGRKTSSGETYNMYHMTAAHTTLPLPTYVKVTNLHNGKQVIVKVNDRGPFRCNRIIDLSYTAAHKLGMLGKGVAHVEVESVDPRDNPHLRGKTYKNIRSRPLLASKTVKPSITTTAAPNVYKQAAAIIKKSTPIKRAKVYLHLGNFTQKNSAFDLAKKIAKLSRAPTAVSQKQSKYIVRIGPILDKEEAVKLTQKLAKARLGTPQVIAE